MQAAASIVVLASLYVLLAVGYVLVYRTSRVLNLAQGDLMMLGGYALFAFVTTVAAPPAAAIPLAVAASAAVGFLIYVLLMARMAGHPVFAAVLVTVSVGILLRVAVVLGFTDQIRYPLPAMGLANPPLRLGAGVAVSTIDAITVLAAAVVMVGLIAFLRGSRLGMQMRAAGERPLLAAQRGIDFQMLFALSWALASLTAGVAGILYGSNVRLDPGLGVLGLKAFAVALVGGLDSLGGVVPAALLVAAVEVLTVVYGEPLLADVSPFLCLLAMLLIRPWGLAGTREELERV
ncbi:MAG: branched-chain amino acid ABC transporter permease [Candidatus Rokuibacteriota bacterium]